MTGLHGTVAALPSLMAMSLLGFSTLCTYVPLALFLCLSCLPQWRLSKLTVHLLATTDSFLNGSPWRPLYVAVNRSTVSDCEQDDFTIHVSMQGDLLVRRLLHNQWLSHLQHIGNEEASLLRAIASIFILLRTQHIYSVAQSQAGNILCMFGALWAPCWQGFNILYTLSPRIEHRSQHRVWIQETEFQAQLRESRHFLPSF